MTNTGEISNPGTEMTSTGNNKNIEYDNNNNNGTCGGNQKQ